MRDVPAEKLAEFVRETLPTTQQDAIQQHLHSCGRCAQLVDFYRDIMSTGSRETAYAPPDGSVRIVKAYFGQQKTATVEVGFELLFDSLMQPELAGARASGVAARQLLYRVGTIYINLEISRESDSGRIPLTGQMLDSSQPGHPPAGVPVVLLNRGRRVARTVSNSNGEFQLELVEKENLKLIVTVHRNQPVCLPIRNAQDCRSSIRPGRRRAANATKNRGRSSR